MKKNKIFKALSTILAVSMMMSAAGCAGGTTESSTPESSESKQESSVAEESKAEGSEAEESTGGTSGYAKDGPDDTSEHYSFEIYANYDWWTVKPWGVDATSAHWNDLFNIDVTWTKPDADPAAKLNLMVSSGDLPDAMFMDFNSDVTKLANLGLLVDIDSLKYEGNEYDKNILPSTQDFMKTEGVLYFVPNWSRKAATGGNASWQIHSDVYEQLGKPDIQTLEDLHDVMVQVKEKGIKNANGETMIPFMTGETADGSQIFSAIYRSLGMPNIVQTYYTQADNKIQFCLRDEKFVEALKIANTWYKEGLFLETNFTDSRDQTTEKLSNGRGAVLYYDFSQDSVNHYNQILEDTFGDRYYVLGYDLDKSPIYPGAEGVKEVYGEEGGTTGGSGCVITTCAENPQRIFDLFCHMLSKQGSIEMMYGPQGGLWDEFDEDGNPILKTPESQLTPEEKDKAGCWFWASPAQSDNVDSTKFAVNSKLPDDQKDWTIDIQATVFSPDPDAKKSKPGQKFITDENTALNLTIDPTEDLGIKRQTISDECKAKLPLIMMAEDDATFDKLVADLLTFVEGQGVAEIEERYNTKRAENIKLQGYSYYFG